MPKLLYARPPLDAREERQVRKLAHSTHAPADWVFHAKMVAGSWDGWRTRAIASDLGCHMQTVRERLQAFNARGLDGLGMQPGSGRPPRLREAERSALIALTRTPPPGKLVPQLDSGELQAHDEKAVAEWTLDALTAAARAQGITVARSLRCGAFSRPSTCAGGARAYGPPVPIRTLPQQDTDRRPLHRSTRGGDGPLCRRTGASNAPHVPARPWLVSR